MLEAPVAPHVLERAVVAVSKEVENRINHRSCTRKTEQALLRELIGCVLGSQVSFEMADVALQRLTKAGLLRKLQVDRATTVSRQVREILRSPVEERYGDLAGRVYRFWATKTQHITRTAQSIYGNGYRLTDFLATQPDERAARAQLIRIAWGIGPKQASLYLRNVGHATELAVLDTHVIAYMRWLRLLTGSLPSVSTLHSYEAVERVLQRYCGRLGSPMSVLDQAIWVVVRVAKSERA